MLLMQDVLGFASLSLVEDPQRATLTQLIQDVASACATEASQTSALPRDISPWIARSPVTIKLRLFCLPYAGGVSENLFARQVMTNLQLLQGDDMLLDLHISLLFVEFLYCKLKCWPDYVSAL